MYAAVATLYMYVCGGNVCVCVKGRERERGSRGGVIMFICVSLCLFLSKCVYIGCDSV